MSISTLQEKFFNKGCGTALIVVAAVAMGASMFTRYGGGSSGNRESGPNGERAENAIALVGGVPVLADPIQAEASKEEERAMQQQADQGHVSRADLGPVPAGVRAQALVSATTQALQAAAIRSLVGSTPVTEAEVSAIAPKAVDATIDRVRGALVQSGKLKADATEADLEKALKDQLGGKTLAQFRQAQADTIVKAFADPKTEGAVLEQFGGPILVQRLGAKTAGSDQALRDSYKTYVVRSVFLSASSGSKDSPEVRAGKVEADLKAGKSFEAEMDAYSNAPALSGKKPHDATQTVPASALPSRPELASLVGKSPNATTPIVDVPGGKAIFQLVSTKDNLPKDFEKNKAKYRDEQVQQAGRTEADKQIKALLAGGSVKWQSAGFQAIAAAGDANANFMDANMPKKAFDLGQTALKSDNPVDRRLGAEALLALTEGRSNFGAKTPEVIAQRTVALEAAQANGLADANSMLEQAGLEGDAKNGAKATDALVAASKANVDTTAQGQLLFGNIAAKALELQKKGVLSAAQLASVQDQQKAWTATREANAKSAAQQKVDAGQQALSNDAEIARQKKEAAAGNVSATPTPAPAGGDTASKANADEIARQKAAAAGGKPPTSPAPAKGGSLLPPGVGH